MKMQTKVKQTMNIKLNIVCLLAAGLVAGCESEAGEHHADIKAEAKITEADARATALTKVPDGTIKEAELEKEKGKLIWSFDIAQPNAEGISEINVDAITGTIVGVEKKDKD
jgi:uncharacterized membrane protein YkoI